MAKITEDYVSFETAKLLKEKGFNEICYLGYNKNGEYLPTGNRCNSQIIQPDFCLICCPTLQMAMKWLREVHNLCIEPYRTACGYLYTISTIPYGSCKCNPREGGDDEDSGQWTTYEGACEAAIKYCLERKFNLN